MSTSPKALHQLTIDDEFEDVIPALSGDELSKLEENLQRDGCRDPIVVWKFWTDGGAGNDIDRVIIDGHNRYVLCHQHEIPFTVKEITDRELPTRASVIEWMIRNQLGRRNLTDFARAEMALKLKPIVEAKAAQREKAGKNASADPSQNSDEGRTDEIVARDAGVSRDTIRKVEVIQANADEETKAKLRRGEKGVSINKVFKQVTAPPQPSQEQEEGDKGGEAHESAKMFDCLGLAVPEAVEPDFGEFARQLKAAKIRLTEFERILKVVLQSPVGRYINAQQVAAEIGNLKRAIKFAVPYTTCPGCSGDGCQSCRETGWMPKDAYDRLPEEQKWNESRQPTSARR